MVKDSNRKNSSCARNVATKVAKRTRRTLNSDSQAEVLRKQIAREKNLMHQRESRKRKRCSQTGNSCSDNMSRSPEGDESRIPEHVVFTEPIAVSPCSKVISESTEVLNAPICATVPFHFSTCFVLGTKYDGSTLLYLPAPDSRRTSVSSSST